MNFSITYALLMITASTFLPQDTNGYFFCGPQAAKLCAKFGGKHIVCYPEQVERNGQFVGMYPSTNKIRRYILERHNYYRDKMASGRETSQLGGPKRFATASRMRELIWDTELEYIAKAHAHRCNLEHDKCRTATKFKYTGQNLGYMAGDDNGTAKEVIDASIDGWYFEKDLVADVDAMPKKSGVVDGIGHLTQMINDQCSRVGCAVAFCVNCTIPGRTLGYCYYLTCDYDCGNIGFVYKTRKTAGSDCAHWETEISHVYPNLCKATGKSFPYERT